MTATAWSQFGAKHNHPSRQADTTTALNPGAPTGTAVGTSNPSICNPSLRTIPPASACAAQEEATMNATAASSDAPVEQAHIPRRNLSEAFEELYIAPEDTSTGNSISATPAMKQADGKDPTSLISPTGVADLHVSPVPHSSDTSVSSCTEASALPPFKLHRDLQRDLSSAVIARVSFYAIVHDINKEATAMAANDDSGFNKASGGGGEEVVEDHSPLVEAVKGPCANRPEISSTMMQAALIDEEKWLLSAIEHRGDDETRSLKSCPPTFLQAMGEREYENPLTPLTTGSRTQLWKPSRSWWEAKSGKNPWIEPKSHNKRWR